MLHVQDLFSQLEKHGCPQRAYIANGHISSCRQSHKTTESEDMHENEGGQKITRVSKFYGFKVGVL